MYYGTYKFEVIGGVGFGSDNGFFDTNSKLECTFVIENPCFDNDMLTINSPETLIRDQLTNVALGSQFINDFSIWP